MDQEFTANYSQEEKGGTEIINKKKQKDLIKVFSVADTCL